MRSLSAGVVCPLFSCYASVPVKPWKSELVVFYKRPTDLDHCVDDTFDPCFTVQ